MATAEALLFAELRARDGGDLVIWGSVSLATSLLAEGLVDELNLMIGHRPSDATRQECYDRNRRAGLHIPPGWLRSAVDEVVQGRVEALSLCRRESGEELEVTDDPIDAVLQSLGDLRLVEPGMSMTVNMWQYARRRFPTRRAGENRRRPRIGARRDVKGDLPQWFVIGMSPRRILPTIWVHRCRVSRVASHRDNVRSGQALPGSRAALTVCS